MNLTSVEICTGLGGQALGLERAGFDHLACIEIDPQACASLRANRPHWNIIETDLNLWDGSPYQGVSLLADGVPCPPFSLAGKQLGAADERDLFPKALQLVAQIRPKAVMLENVRGLLDPRFAAYRENVDSKFRDLGYRTDWKLLNASDFGVSQLRPRVVLVAFKDDLIDFFSWPLSVPNPPLSVGELLLDLMQADGWTSAIDWAKSAADIAPTLVGGSKKHGGPDLGPTRARAAWAKLGVDGRGLADAPPSRDFVGYPRLTVRMAARIQGFPDSWVISGRKTSAYRQVGNAFPPPVATAVGLEISKALAKAARREAA